jgi:hypothetical protein
MACASNLISRRRPVKRRRDKGGVILHKVEYGKFSLPMPPIRLRLVDSGNFSQSILGDADQILE